MIKRIKSDQSDQSDQRDQNDHSDHVRLCVSDNQTIVVFLQSFRLRLSDNFKYTI